MVVERSSFLVESVVRTGALGPYTYSIDSCDIFLKELCCHSLPRSSRNNEEAGLTAYFISHWGTSQTWKRISRAVSFTR